MFAADPSPLTLEVLVLPDATLMLTAAVLEPLRAANRILGRRQYAWEISTPDGEPAPTASGIPIPAMRAFDPAVSAAPLLVVASYNVMAQMRRDLIRRLSAARRYRPTIGAVESAVFLIAEAGLLAGRAASPHWEDIDDFASRYPDIDVRPDRFIIDGPRFTAGGASPTLDLMLELIRRRQGYPLALDVSKAFIYDPNRNPDPAGAGVSLGRLIGSDPRVATAVRLMDAHLAEPLSIEAIALRAGVGARHLQTLFVKTLGVGPRDYYVALRLNLARRQIIETTRPFTDIAAACGFSQLGVFGRAYGARYGETPTATRRNAGGGR
ncbi:MAG: GlxA family transcriptional regulator [Hyphomicrobiaceae bacterium]|nr:GlxA family transcriptional regulator [Hyphomicrobiaceae bacterium]